MNEDKGIKGVRNNIFYVSLLVFIFCFLEVKLHGVTFGLLHINEGSYNPKHFKILILIVFLYVGVRYFQYFINDYSLRYIKSRKFIISFTDDFSKQYIKNGTYFLENHGNIRIEDTIYEIKEIRDINILKKEFYIARGSVILGAGPRDMRDYDTLTKIDLKNASLLLVLISVVKNTLLYNREYFDNVFPIFFWAFTVYLFCFSVIGFDNFSYINLIIFYLIGLKGLIFKGDLIRLYKNYKENSNLKGFMFGVLILVINANINLIKRFYLFYIFLIMLILIEYFDIFNLSFLYVYH